MMLMSHRGTAFDAALDAAELSRAVTTATAGSATHGVAATYRLLLEERQNMLQGRGATDNGGGPATARFGGPHVGAADPSAIKPFDAAYSLTTLGPDTCWQAYARYCLPLSPPLCLPSTNTV